MNPTPSECAWFLSCSLFSFFSLFFFSFLSPHSLQDQACITREVNLLTTGQLRASYGDEDEERAEVNFKTMVFLENLAIQLAHPLPWVYYREGWAGLRNRDFLAPTSMFVLQWLVFASFYSSVVLFAVCRPAHISVAEIILLSVAFVVRQMVVATKYAYMSPVELRERQTRSLTTTRIREQEVLSVWFTLVEESVDHQLHLACIRKKLDLKRYVFEVPQRANEEYAENEVYEARFNAFTVGKEILLAAGMAQDPRITFAA